jgi:hypothetical protein
MKIGGGLIPLFSFWPRGIYKFYNGEEEPKQIEIVS